MYFNERIGLDIKEEHHKIRRRVAVRAVIMEKQKILLMQTNKGDFKFPGGGVERNEGLIEALSREVKEETGYTHCAVKECMGKVIENQVDQYDKQAYFQMISHYYMCELVKSEKGELELDAYESELEFTPVWVSVDRAIEENKYASSQFNSNPWVARENLVLEKIKDFIYLRRRV